MDSGLLTILRKGSSPIVTTSQVSLMIAPPIIMGKQVDMVWACSTATKYTTGLVCFFVGLV